MVDVAHLDRLRHAFTRLLTELGPIWPKQDLDYVSDEVGHGEYGDALENLVAIGLRNGKGFRPPHVKQIEALAAAMEMGDSHFLTQLRDVMRQDAALPR
jgi:hypothetical protein